MFTIINVDKNRFIIQYNNTAIARVRASIVRPDCDIANATGGLSWVSVTPSKSSKLWYELTDCVQSNKTNNRLGIYELREQVELAFLNNNCTWNSAKENYLQDYLNDNKDYILGGLVSGTCGLYFKPFKTLKKEEKINKRLLQKIQQINNGVKKWQK